jgi:hypothetical protein
MCSQQKGAWDEEQEQSRWINGRCSQDDDQKGREQGGRRHSRGVVEAMLVARDRVIVFWAQGEWF